MTANTTSPSDPTSAASAEPTLFSVAAALLRARRTILLTVTAGAVLGGGVAFLRTRTWSSGFSFVPLQGNASVGGLAGLAGQFGINVGSLAGGGRPPEFFVAAVQTREVLLPVLQDSIETNGRRASVLDILEVEGASEAVRLERGLKLVRNVVLTVGVADRQSSIVRVSVRTESAEVSRGIAALLLESLNRFNVASRQGQASVERRFARERLDSSLTALAAAEDRLAAFVERNRDLSSSAALSLQRDRLQREVTVQQQLVTALTQQYEEARLREFRDTPEISVVERPFTPPLPNSRMAAVTLVVGALAGFIVAVLVVLVRDAWTAPGGRDGLSALSAEWRSLRERESTRSS